MTVRRYDSIHCDAVKAKRLDNGFLRVDAQITRCGIFDYVLPGGKVRRELRPPEEVFKQDAIDSFKLVPLTEDLSGLGKGHPREGFVDTKNSRRVTVGIVGEDVRQDGDHVSATIQVQDADTIKRVEAGKVFLSCGYSADTDEAPGEWQGQRYDAIQRNIRGNHVAIVDAGRAGPSARLRLDSEEDPTVGFQIDSPKEEHAMRKFIIDAIEFEVSESAAQAWEKQAKLDGEKLAQAAKEAGEQKTRADAADAKVAELVQKTDAAEKARADLEAKIPALVEARVSLITEARKVLGAEAKFDGLDDTGIRKAVIAKVDPEAKLDGATPDFVAGAYASALKTFAAKPAPATVRTDAIAPPAVDRKTAFLKAVESACVVK